MRLTLRDLSARIARTIRAFGLTVRLTARQQQMIKESVIEVFGDAATIRLFGSRVDDDKSGGDIDLYLEVPSMPDPDMTLLDRKARLLRVLWQRLGAQRIDLLVREGQQPLSSIHRDALEHGVLL